MTVRARVESTGGVGSSVRVGSHTLVFDQPLKDGGDDRGASPLAVFAAAAGACAHYYAAAFLTRRRLPVDGLVVDVLWDKATDAPTRIGRIHLEVHVPDTTPEAYLEAIERSVRTCPAYGTLVRSPEVLIQVRRGAGTRLLDSPHA